MDQAITPETLPLDHSIYSDPYFTIGAFCMLIIVALALKLVFKSDNKEYVHNHQFE